MCGLCARSLPDTANEEDRNDYDFEEAFVASGQSVGEHGPVAGVGQVRPAHQLGLLVPVLPVERDRSLPDRLHKSNPICPKTEKYTGFLELGVVMPVFCNPDIIFLDS